MDALYAVELTVGQGTAGEADIHLGQRGIKSVLGLQAVGHHRDDSVPYSVCQEFPRQIFYHPGSWNDDLEMRNEDNVQHIIRIPACIF